MMRSTLPASFSLSRSSFSSHFQQPKSPRLLCKGSTNPTAGLVATVLRIFIWKLELVVFCKCSRRQSRPNKRDYILWAWFHVQKIPPKKDHSLTHNCTKLAAWLGWLKWLKQNDGNLGAKLREKGIVGPLLLHNLKENNKIEAPCILESRDVSNQEMAMENSKVTICRCVSVWMYFY